MSHWAHHQRSKTCVCVNALMSFGCVFHSCGVVWLWLEDDRCHFSQMQRSPKVSQCSVCSSSGDHDQRTSCHADRSIELRTDACTCVPESSESLLSGASSMSSSDISISSSRLMPISCSLCKFRISCKAQTKAGGSERQRLMGDASLSIESRESLSGGQRGPFDSIINVK